MKNKGIIITIIVALIAAGIYTKIVVSLEDPEQLWEWGHSFVSILVSLLLAYSSQLLFNNWDENNERIAKINRYIELLRSEIDDIKIILTESPKHEIELNGNTYSWIATEVKTYIVDEIFKSGLFNSKNNIDTYSLEISRLVNTYSIQNNHILHGMFRKQENWNPDTLIILIDSCNNTKENILDAINDLEKVLNSIKKKKGFLY